MPDENNGSQLKPYDTNSLGYKLKFLGPKTVEYYDTKGGKVGLCLEDAVDNTIYRGTLPEWQAEFAKRLTELTGQERQVNEKATKEAKSRSKTPEKVKDILETIKTFHNRVTADMGEEDKKALAVMAQECADKIVIDPSPSKRQGGVPKDCKDKAESWNLLPTDQVEEKITKYADQYEIDLSVIERDEQNRPTVESLGRFIKAIMDARRDEL